MTTTRDNSQRRLWFIGIVFMFVVIFTIGFTTIRHQTKTKRIPHRAGDLAVLLVEQISNTHAISSRTDGLIESNFYLTTRPINSQKLGMLPRSEQFADQWNGVVLCDKYICEPDAKWISSLGKYCLVIPPFVFFGDPELLEKIRTVMAH